MNGVLRQLFALIFLCGCSPSQPTKPLAPSPFAKVTLAEVTLSKEQEIEIRALIDQLAIEERPATNEPMRNPHMKIFDADGNDATPGRNTEATEQYRRRFELCQSAFQKLSDFKLAAFPILIEHLDDKRQSINFRNHYLNNSVGDACRWNIYFQLQDRPEGYSEYGEGRKGRDGQTHTKPYWEGTPFDEAGDVKQWLEENKDLRYAEMQIKCLQWLLECEKKIGAPDADSYFLNILPLEIRILERRLELGEDVRNELEKLKKGLENRDATIVPRELLPE